MARQGLPLDDAGMWFEVSFPERGSGLLVKFKPFSEHGQPCCRCPQTSRYRDPVPGSRRGAGKDVLGHAHHRQAKHHNGRPDHISAHDGHIEKAR